MSWIDDGPLTWKASLNKSQRPRQRQSLYLLRSAIPAYHFASLRRPPKGQNNSLFTYFAGNSFHAIEIFRKKSNSHFFPSLCFRNRLYRRGRADRETLAKYNQNWACRKIFPILWKMCTTITQSFVRDLSSRFP